MKKIEAVIRHYKLEDVKNALTTAGIDGMTVSEVRGYRDPPPAQPRREEHIVCFLPKLKLEVVVNDSQLVLAVERITQAARTGKHGDGKIFVTNLEDVIRIRTGESGPEAI